MRDHAADLLITDARLPDGQGPVDILVSRGRVAEIGAGLEHPHAVREDAAGAVVLPAFTDAHCHADKTVWGSGRWLSHVAADTLEARIANNARIRDDWGIPNRDFSRNLLEQFVLTGTTRIRSHTDVDAELGLRGVEMMAELAREFEGLLDIEQVAFPQQGLLGDPHVVPLLEEATRHGVDVIGGIDPAGRDGDAVASLDATFDLARRTGTAIDIHLHDHGLLGIWEIDLVCERTRSEDMGGKVTISHAYALGDVPADVQHRTIAHLAEAGVRVVTAVPFDSPVLPLRAMTEAGVVVGLGNDSIRNTWSPFGTADMLQRAMIAGTRYETRHDEELAWVLDLAAAGGARVMGAEAPAVAVGSPADLVLVDALNQYDAVVSVPARRAVVKQGAVVARDGRVLRTVEMTS